MKSSEQRKLAYTEAVEQFRLHAPLVWTRNNFFLIVNSGLLAFYSGAGEAWRGLPLLIPTAGIFLSLIWIWVTLAGRHLQREWRRLVIEIEQDLFKPERGQTAIKGPFSRADAITGEGRNLIVSINTALIVLSVGFLVCWGYFLGQAIMDYCVTNP